MKKLLLLSLSFFAAIAVSQVPTNGLIGRWEFSGNANDASASNNHGTVSGAVLTSDRCGNPNSAYQFDGVDDYIVMQQAGPTGNASRTVSFWALTSYTTFGSSQLATSIFMYGGGNSPYGTSYQVNYNYMCQGVGIDVGNHQFIRGNGCISDNNWHHVALVLNSNGSSTLADIIIYVDGIPLPPQITCYVTGTTQVLATTAFNPIYIGGFSSGVKRCFPGTIDDVYLYNRALSPAEVQQLYTTCQGTITGTPNVCSGSSATYSVPAGTGAYIWSLPQGWTGTSSTNVINVTAGNGSGVMSVQYPSACGGLVTRTLAVGNVAPVVTVNGSTICTGSSATLSAAGNYSCTWMPGSLSGSTVVVTPTATTTSIVVYTLTANGPNCSGTTTTSVFVSRCLDVREQAALPEVRIYPNPSRGMFSIDLENTGTPLNCSVVNLLGEEIYRTTLKENTTHAITLQAAKGLYIITLQSVNSKYITQKKIMVD